MKEDVIRPYVDIMYVTPKIVYKKAHKVDFHESVHRDTITKMTNKMHYIDYFIIPGQLYTFRAMLLPIIRII
jgi:hypothetical protein